MGEIAIWCRGRAVRKGEDARTVDGVLVVSLSASLQFDRRGDHTYGLFEGYMSQPDIQASHVRLGGSLHLSHDWRGPSW